MQVRRRCTNETQSPEEVLASFKQSAQFDGTTKRILPDDVLAAFRKLGVKPEQCIFVFDDRRCGLTAVIEAREFVLGSNFDIFHFAAYLKLSGLYTCGFMWGWDVVADDRMEPKIREVAPNWAIGVDDGRAAWKACRHLAWPLDYMRPPKGKGDME